MHNHASYDTSSQAMTEVALGLSMAFFALLILALLSMQLPKLEVESAVQSQHQSELQTPIKVSQNSAKSDQKMTGKQFVVFYQGQFLDQLLQPINMQQLSLTETVVLAVEQSLAFSEVVAIRDKINHPNLSITLLNNEWQQRLEQLP